MKKIQLNINDLGRGYKVLLAATSMLLLIFSSCKKKLNVENPNAPTFDVNVSNEEGLAAYAKGGVYWNGFN